MRVMSTLPQQQPLTRTAQPVSFEPAAASSRPAPKFGFDVTMGEVFLGGGGLAVLGGAVGFGTVYQLRRKHYRENQAAIQEALKNVIVLEAVGEGNRVDSSNAASGPFGFQVGPYQLQTGFFSAVKGKLTRDPHVLDIRNQYRRPDEDYLEVWDKDGKNRLLVFEGDKADLDLLAETYFRWISTKKR